MALRWRKNKSPTGLARIGSGPDGYTLFDGDVRYAVASAMGRGKVAGWFWVAGWDSGVPHMNTCKAPVATAELAKTAALHYVRRHVALNPRKTELPSAA